MSVMDNLTEGDKPLNEEPNENMGAQLFFTTIINMYELGSNVIVIDFEKKTGEKGKLRVDISDATVTGNRPLSDEAKTQIGELVGEATMQWKPVPSGVFQSEAAGEIVKKIIEVAEND